MMILEKIIHYLSYYYVIVKYGTHKYNTSVHSFFPMEDEKKIPREYGMEQKNILLFFFPNFFNHALIFR